MHNNLVILHCSWAALCTYALNMKNIIMILSILIAASAQAMTGAEFKAFVFDTQSRCPQFNCDAQIKLANLPPEEVLEFDYSTQQALKATGQEFAEYYWRDSILEGFYKNEFKIELRRVQVLIKDGERVGYRITYADRAVDLSSCEFDSEAPEHLTNCKSGYIVESAFVANDLNTKFVDQLATAKFK